MRSFVAFLKKEFLESLRSGKLIIIGTLFVLFGVMNPAVAKLTPWLVEAMADSLAESGMTVTEVTVDALTSWTQFFKNMPMALIAFVLIYGGVFTKEYESGSLVLILTRGISRSRVFFAKALTLASLWTIGYLLSFVITYLYTEFFWDNSIVENLFASVAYFWLFGLFVISLMLLFSVILRGYSGVLLGTGGAVIFCYVLSLFKRIRFIIPTTLMDGMAVITEVYEKERYILCVAVTLLISIAFTAVSIPMFNKKEI